MQNLAALYGGIERALPNNSTAFQKINAPPALRWNNLGQPAYATFRFRERRCPMDADHVSSARISVGDRRMRPLGRLVGVIWLPRRVGRMQRNQSVNALSGAVLISLPASIAFRRVSRFARAALEPKTDAY